MLDRDMFGSKKAYELAVAAGYTRATFEGVTATGDHGYTTIDVRRLKGQTRLTNTPDYRAYGRGMAAGDHRAPWTSHPGLPPGIDPEDVPS